MEQPQEPTFTGDTTWRGKRIEEMTRGELIAALEWYALRHDALTSPDATLTRMVGMSERIARGI